VLKTGILDAIGLSIGDTETASLKMIYGFLPTSLLDERWKRHRLAGGYKVCILS
jgi:hypothetical protein